MAGVVRLVCLVEVNVGSLDPAQLRHTATPLQVDICYRPAAYIPVSICGFSGTSGRSLSNVPNITSFEVPVSIKCSDPYLAISSQTNLICLFT